MFIKTKREKKSFKALNQDFFSRRFCEVEDQLEVEQTENEKNGNNAYTYYVYNVY